MSYSKPLFYKNFNQLPKGTKVVNAFDSQIKELFYIKHPKYKHDHPNVSNEQKKFINKQKINPVIVYYPWKKLAIKNVPEDIYFELRTNRNKNVVNKKEQTKFRSVKVGIAGLSVGSAVLSALNLSGGPKFFKIADFDVLETTNLNRLHAGLPDIGQNKTYIAAQRLWELDPYLNLDLYPNGLTKENLKKFLLQPKLDIFVDEMDNIELKILARQLCKKHKIPVLMATDNGEGILLDVERYDQNPKQLPFNGRLKGEKFNNLNNLPFAEWLKLANKIVGFDYLSERMQKSLKQIGKSLTAVPQLGASANLAGSCVSFAVRKIANKQKLNSGRYSFDLESTFYAARA